MFNRLGILFSSILFLGSVASAQSMADEKTIKTHKRVLTLDAHADVLLPSSPRSSYLPSGGSRADLDHLTQGGVDAIVLAVAVGSGPRDSEGVAAARREADEKLAAIKALIARNPNRMSLALSARDVKHLHRKGKIAVIIGFQNARSIGKDLSQINVFYKEGVRVFALNHAGHNDFSDSSRHFEEPASEHGGLSPLGREAIKLLNDLGVLIDVSQTSAESLYQTLQITRSPVVATHSAARALIDNPRNLSDAELDAIKSNGGVVQVVPFSPYVHSQDQASLEKIGAVRVRYGLPAYGPTPTDGIYGLPREAQPVFLDEIRKSQSRGTIKEFVNHIDYIAKRIGWRHVGIGSDFDHGGGVIGFDSEADAPNVTHELLARGYTEKQIAAIWGGNFLRVMRAAETHKSKN